MIAFQSTIRIERRLEDVFAYVADLRNLPAWNSAVRTVRATSPASSEVGSTYTMERRLPTGPATNELEIVAREQPNEFAIRFGAAARQRPGGRRPKTLLLPFSADRLTG